MRSNKTKTGINRHRYYHCSKKSNVGPDIPCNNRTWSADTLEYIVWQQVEKALSNPSVIAAGIEGIRKQARSASNSGTELETAMLRLSHLEKEKDRVWKAFEITGDQDTLYSSIVLPIYVGITTTLGAMSGVLSAAGSDNKEEDSAGCMAVPLLLPNLMLGLYLNVFHFINMKISRKREDRADLVATLTCGSYSFTDGLRKATVFEGVFQATAYSDILAELEKGKTFENYYREFRNALPRLTDLINESEQEASAEATGGKTAEETLHLVS